MRLEIVLLLQKRIIAIISLEGYNGDGGGSGVGVGGGGDDGGDVWWGGGGGLGGEGGGAFKNYCLSVRLKY